MDEHQVIDVGDLFEVQEDTIMWVSANDLRSRIKNVPINAGHLFTVVAVLGDVGDRVLEVFLEEGYLCVVLEKNMKSKMISKSL